MLGFQLTSETSEDELPLRLLLSGTPYGEYIHLDLGHCRHAETPWAKVLIHHADDASTWGTPLDEHHCNEHHIASWTEGKKMFGDAATRGVLLSFVRCSLATATDSTTLAAHIELVGSVYANIEIQAKLLRHGPELPESIRTAPSLAPVSLILDGTADSRRRSWPMQFFVLVGNATSWPLRLALGTSRRVSANASPSVVGSTAESAVRRGSGG